MKRILLILGGLIALLVIGAVAATFLIDPNHFRPLLEAELTHSLGREVKLGDLKLSLLAGSVTANDLSIADDPAYSRTPFVQAKSLAIRVELWPLLTARKLNVTGLTIDQPTINLIQRPDGDWNFSKLGSDKSPAPPKPAAPATDQPMDLSVKLIKITAGHFSLDRNAGHGRPLVLDDVALEVRDFAAATSFPFTFATKVAGGGTVKIEGKAGPIDPADVSETPLTATLDVDKLDLAGTGITQSAPAIGGLIAFHSTVESTGKAAQIKGKLKAGNMKFARDGAPCKRPLEFDFTLNHNLHKRSGQLQQGAIRIGAAPASLTGTYAQHGESTAVQMNLDGRKMPLPELTALLPALGVVLPNGSSLQGGTASVKLAMQGPLDALVTTGNLSLDNTKLAGFDIGRKLAAIEKFTGIKASPDTEIQTLGATLRVGPEGITADKVELILPALGNLEGSGTSTPAHVLDFKMRATVHTSGLLAAVDGTPIPFTVQGPAADPIFLPDMKGLAREQLNKYTGGDAVGKATDLLKGLFKK